MEDLRKPTTKRNNTIGLQSETGVPHSETVH